MQKIRKILSAISEKIALTTNYFQQCQSYKTSLRSVQLPRKPLFYGHFSTKGIFPKDSAITISVQKSFNQSAQFIKSFVRYTWFKSPMIFKPLLIFYHTHTIIIKVTFSFINLYPHAKNQPNSSIHSWDTADFRAWDLNDHILFSSPPCKNY